MNYRQPHTWYSPYQSSGQGMMPGTMPMMPGNMQQMMAMMTEHVRMTEDIRRVVYEINERCKRMEAKMMR